MIGGAIDKQDRSWGRELKLVCHNSRDGAGRLVKSPVRCAIVCFTSPFAEGHNIWIMDWEYTYVFKVIKYQFILSKTGLCYPEVRVKEARLSEVILYWHFIQSNWITLDNFYTQLDFTKKKHPTSLPVQTF